MQMANFFLQRYTAAGKVKPPKLSPKAEQAILQHPWPGNVRELENTILRALHFSKGTVITPENLELHIDSREPMLSDTGGKTLKQIERRSIEAVLRRNNFNMARTSRELGISRATLYRKTSMYGLTEK